ASDHLLGQAEGRGLEQEERMSRRSVGLALTSALAGAVLAGVALAQAGSRLYLRGQAISNRVRVIDGVPYAPVADLARATGMTVQRKPDGYALVAAGGANQVNARVTGKVGDDLFTGDWRFRVLDVKTTDLYTPRYREDRAPVRPRGAGDVLVVVSCQVKNGHNAKELLYFSNSVRVPDQATLTDSKAQSYEATYCDVHFDYYNYGAYALPGASIPFAVVFSVPRDTDVKDLVYRIFRYDDRGNPARATTVRVGLTR
ncbi:MAG TPA: hypothetical protein VFU47_06945, partial [Armatimonadota bacterium]|nr:hypothetical protein [Armatimonadota bacterium]